VLYIVNIKLRDTIHAENVLMWKKIANFSAFWSYSSQHSYSNSEITNWNI